jgi:hypothetical protein
MTIRWTVRAKIAKRPKNGFLTPKWPFWLFSPYFHILHEYYLYKQTIDVIIKRKGEEEKEQNVCVLTRIRNLVSTFHSQKALDGGFTQ